MSKKDFRSAKVACTECESWQEITYPIHLAGTRFACSKCGKNGLRAPEILAAATSKHEPTSEPTEPTKPWALSEMDKRFLQGVRITPE